MNHKKNINNQLRVAYFVHASNLTGANRSLIDLIVSLKDKNVIPIVIIPEHGVLEEALKDNGIKYYLVPYYVWLCGIDYKKTVSVQIKHVIKEAINKILIIKAAKILRAEKIQIIHSNSLLMGFGADVASAMKLPHIWHMREFMIEDHKITFYNERRAIKMAKKADRMIAISDLVAQKFEKWFDRPVTTIYNGVPIANYAVPEKKIFSGERINILICGRIFETKGQLEAIQAVEILKDDFINIHLKIVGNGIDGNIYEDNIKQYVIEHDLGDLIEFIPFQSNMRKFYEESDIQLVCSWYEAFGRVTVEGMLSHALVIGADAGCTPYLIKNNETGLLFESRNSTSLAETLRYALSNQEASTRIADKGYKTALRVYDIDKVAIRVKRLYSEVI